MTEPPAKGGRGLRIALTLSLALNLLVAGLLAGAMLRDGPAMRSAMVRDLGFGPFSEALTREDRKALRRALIDRAPELRDERKRRLEELGEILVVLRAEPFDPAGFSTLMDGQRSRMAAQLALGHDLLVAHVTAMTAKERQAFAERLEHGLKHRGKPDKDATRGDKPGNGD